jgi:hypothetical protein
MAYYAVTAPAVGLPGDGSQAQDDPGSDVPGSFDDVDAAFFRHELSVEEYELLRRAAVEALRAQREP